MPEYGVRGVVRGRVGCVLGGLLVVVFSTVGQLIAWLVTSVVSSLPVIGSSGGWPASSVGVVVWLAVTVAGSWWSIRTVARRRTQTVFWCVRCGVRTDPTFDVCSSCGRLKSP